MAAGQWEAIICTTIPNFKIHPTMPYKMGVSPVAGTFGHIIGHKSAKCEWILLQYGSFRS